MMKLRLAHFYLGVFFAPLIVFFAFTGVLQVFKLHEAYRQVPGAQGKDDWIAWFASFHKEQAWIAPKAERPNAERPGAAPPGAQPDSRGKDPVAQPMKWLVAAMGVALMLTTCIGLYIAFSYPKRRRGFFVALVTGIATPLALMVF
jgi:hypothetical protein